MATSTAVRLGHHVAIDNTTDEGIPNATVRLDPRLGESAVFHLRGAVEELLGDPYRAGSFMPYELYIVNWAGGNPQPLDETRVRYALEDLLGGTNITWDTPRP